MCKLLKMLTLTETSQLQVFVAFLDLSSDDQCKLSRLP